MKKPNQTRSKHPSPRRRGRREVLRFAEIAGKTVEFVEVDLTFDFPCVEIGFQDKTALHLLLGIAGFTVEPQYSAWKAGNERVLKACPVVRGGEESGDRVIWKNRVVRFEAATSALFKQRRQLDGMNSRSIPGQCGNVPGVRSPGLQ